MRRLLILACSKRKNPAKEALPAIDRYNGPAFLVLRKYLREEPTLLTSVFILSAKYGLIPAGQKIPDYDHRLSAAAAVDLRLRVQTTLQQMFESQPFHAVGVCAGKEYLLALTDVFELLPQDVRVEFIRGGLGQRLTNLRLWLRQEGKPGPVRPHCPSRKNARRKRLAAKNALQTAFSFQPRSRI